MNDKHIEDILRESWSPEPPEGMRERILRRGRVELLHEKDNKRRRWFTWRTAMVAAGIVTVLLTNLADMSTRSKVAEMTKQASPQCFTTVAQRPISLGQWRYSMNEYLSSNKAVELDGNGLKGVDTP